MLRIAMPALAEEFLVLLVIWTDWFLASRYLADDGDATKFVFTAVGFFVVRIPLAFYFAFDTFTVPFTEVTIQGMGWGVAGAWYAMVADLVIRSLMIGARFYYGGWRDIKI